MHATSGASYSSPIGPALCSTRAGGAGSICRGALRPDEILLISPASRRSKGAALPRDRRSRAATRRGKALSIASTIEDPPFDGRKPADTGFPCSVERLPIRGIESAAASAALR